MIDYTPLVQHTSLFYKSEEEYLDVVIPYLKAGLEGNEFCAWILPETLKVKDARAHLSRSVENLDAYFIKKQISITDYRSFYLKDDVFSASGIIETIIEVEKIALERGFKGIRGTGDASWALGAYWFRFLIYEKQLNGIISGHKIKALCTYLIEKLEIRSIYNIGINHQASLVKQNGSWNRLDPSGFAKANIC